MTITTRPGKIVVELGGSTQGFEADHIVVTEHGVRAYSAEVIEGSLSTERRLDIGPATPYLIEWDDERNDRMEAGDG